MVQSSFIRKASAAALALTLGASLLAGCSGNSGNSDNGSGNQTSDNQTQTTTETKADPFGKQPELTVLTRGTWANPDAKYPDGQSLEDNAYTRKLKSDYNIEIKNAFVASDYPKQVDLAIASGTIPDFLTNLTYPQYRAIVKAGLAMDISEVWEKYASPNVKTFYDSNKELFDSLVKEDGKMYAIPGAKPLVDFLPVMWIRQDWLDKLGLKAPTNLDELAAVAKAFIEQDPDGNNKADTVGLVGPKKDGKLYQDMDDQNFGLHFDPIFSAFNAFPGFWVKDSNGEAVYGSILPETKAALQKLADMYKQGLITQDMLTSNTEELISNNKAGLFFGTWWNPFTEIGNSWKNDNKANWQPYLLPSGADGITLAKGGNAASQFAVISKNAKNPEAIIKLLNIKTESLDKLVSKEDRAVLSDYPYPFYLTYSLADGPAKILQGMIDYEAGKGTLEEHHAKFDSYDPGANAIFDKMIAYKKEPYNDTNISTWDFSGDKANDFGLVYSFGVGLRPYVSGKFKWVNTLTYVKTATMDKRWANLKKLEYETFSKIIVGQPIDTFDSFVEQWKKEGGDQVTKEIQESLNQ
jgi:putative aldouronate transport system substrate-binding protein